MWAVVANFVNTTVPGWTSQVLLISLFAAVQMVILGIISEYVGRIYFQVQGRPLYVVSEVITKEEAKAKS